MVTMIYRGMTALMVAIAFSGCALFDFGAYTNEPLTTGSATAPEGGPLQAGFKLRKVRSSAACDAAGTPLASPKKEPSVLVLLALSGGGSRAAFFSALVMEELQHQTVPFGSGVESDLLHEIDAISSVSGGSLAGAYYAISHDPGQACAAPSRREWNPGRVDALMRRNYLRRWVGNWFWPVNVVRYWLTDFDRTDIMAQTLADNLFDKRGTGVDVSLGELNPLRPNLIINATAGSYSDGGQVHFGDVFSFTDEDFRRICSSVDTYSVARAVMASATFPGAFNFMTLRDFGARCTLPDEARDDGRRRYLHVFDGGNSDNLGLSSVRRVIWEALQEDANGDLHLPYRNVVVIQVDAFIHSPGADPFKSDARNLVDFVVDLNFIDATDSLLEANRDRLLEQFRRGELFPFGAPSAAASENDCVVFFRGEEIPQCALRPADTWHRLNEEIGSKLTFVHLRFDKVPDVVAGCGENPACLRSQLNRIGTSFKFQTDPNPQTGLVDAQAIACAVPALFGRSADEPANDAHAQLPCGALVLAPNPDAARCWSHVRGVLQGVPQETGASVDVCR